MKQNINKSNCTQLFHNNSEFWSRHWEFNQSSHKREFNLSHVPNPLDMNESCTNV